ncbi:MAG: c-type cytochrome [Hyphomicrobiales bacterium]
MKRVLAILLLLAAAPLARADGDPTRGEKAFRMCSACHSAIDDTNKVGPHLKGVVGRRAGGVEGYEYSAAMKAVGEEGLVWTEENLEAYLASPKIFVPGNKMAYPGVKKANERDDIIAYLKTQM